MKKLICILLATSMSITPVLAVGSVGSLSSNTLYVSYEGHGCYSTSNAQNILSSAEKTRINQYNEDIYQIADTKSKDLLLRVNENTFLEVSEVSIDVDDSVAVEQVITDYELSEYFANELRAINDKLETGALASCTVTMYTPITPAATTLTTESTQGAQATLYTNPTSVYYTGYGNRNYYDTVFHISATSNFYEVSGLSGNTYQQIADLVIQGAMLAADLTLPTPVGVAFSILDIVGSLFAGGQSYPTSTVVSTLAASVENKIIKQTAMQYYNEYIWGAISCRGNQTWQFMERVPGQLYTTPTSGEQKTYTRPNYWNLDQKAYNVVMNSLIVFNEEVREWSLSGYNFTISSP